MLGEEGLGKTRAAWTQQEVFSCHWGQRATSLAGPCRERLGMCPVMSRKGKEGRSVFTKAMVGCTSPSQRWPWQQCQRAILSPAAVPREDRLLQRNPSVGPSSPATCPKDVGCLREPRYWQCNGDDTGHFSLPDSSATHCRLYKTQVLIGRPYTLCRQVPNQHFHGSGATRDAPQLCPSRGPVRRGHGTQAAAKPQTATAARQPAGGL